MRVTGLPGLVDRPSDCMSVRTIPLSGCVDIRFCYKIMVSLKDVFVQCDIINVIYMCVCVFVLKGPTRVNTTIETSYQYYNSISILSHSKYIS